MYVPSCLCFCSSSLHRVPFWGSLFKVIVGRHAAINRRPPFCGTSAFVILRIGPLFLLGLGLAAVDPGLPAVDPWLWIRG